jgi:hypothetical protein
MDSGPDQVQYYTIKRKKDARRANAIHGKRISNSMDVKRTGIGVRHHVNGRIPWFKKQGRNASIGGIPWIWVFTFHVLISFAEILNASAPLLSLL